MTSPPRPPSPPLGPPRGTYFSRRKARQPLPPSPALTRMRTSSINMEKPPARGRAGGPREESGGYSEARMLTNLPMRPRSLNSTTPVTLANRVSSLPQPTLAPGLILVPRCRTITDPPGTSWPPNTFTPSRCALESRPFLELPSPFLCAMRHLHQNLADFQLCESLTVSNGFLILLLALELEHQHFGVAPVAYDGGAHGAALDHFAAVRKCHGGGKLDFRADVASQFLHADGFPGRDYILFPAGRDYRLHQNLCCWEPDTRNVSELLRVNYECTTGWQRIQILRPSASFRRLPNLELYDASGVSPHKRLCPCFYKEVSIILC